MPDGLPSVRVDAATETAVVSIDSRLYATDVVYDAAYALLDRAHPLLGGDPEGTVVVTLAPKRPVPGEGGRVARAFCDQLIAQAVHARRERENKAERDAMVARALAFTVLPAAQLGSSLPASAAPCSCESQPSQADAGR